MNVTPEEIKRRIDEALAEIEEVESEVFELFAELLGPDAAGRLAAYIEAQENQPRVAPLRSPRGVDGR